MGVSYTVPQEADDSNKLTPYIGAVYNLNDTHTLYASYTGIYKPQVETDASNQPLAPLKVRILRRALKVIGLTKI